MLAPQKLRAIAGSPDLKDSFKDWFEHYQLRRDKQTVEAKRQTDVAWYEEKVAMLTRQLAELDQRHTEKVREYDDALRKQHDEAVACAQDRDRNRWEWLKTCLTVARQQAETRAVIEAYQATHRHRWLGPKPGPWTRDRAIEVTPVPADAAQVGAERPALVFTGPFRAGTYRVAVEFRDGTSVDGVIVCFSNFLEGDWWGEVKHPLPVSTTDAKGASALADVALERPAASCTLVVPAACAPANITHWELRGPL
jgi:hypothetical protein